MNDLLKKLHSKNITINLVENQLDIKAPKGTMTKELLSEIKEHKQALIAFMSEYKLENAGNVTIPKAAHKPSYALSSSQYRLWIVEELENNNGAYNMPSVFSVKGAINIQQLEKAFIQLTERHEILRTNIIVEKQTRTPKQYIAPVNASRFKLNYIDLSEDKEVSKTLQNAIKKEVEYNFDLKSDALFRVSVLKKADNDYILTSVMHHIISDGWSSSILIADLFSLYQSITKGEDSQLAPLSIQYKDFAEWQQSKLNSDTAKINKEYWLNQFKEEVPILEIPSYKLRPSVKTYNGKTIEKRFETNVIQNFKNICKSEGATLFMGLLAAVKIILYKYTKQTDMVVGSPFAGREHAELQNQIGFYVHTIGLRTSFKKTDTFKTLLNQIKKTTLEANAHQEYPFDELIKNLELTIDRSRNPLFDVMLTVDSQEETSDTFDLLEGLIVEEIALTNTTSKFDLEFAFKENKYGSDIQITYNTAIYTEDFIRQIINHLEVVLKSIVSNSELTVESIPYLTATEKATLLHDFNDTTTIAKHDNNSYIELFEAQAKKTPENIAVVFKEKQVSYKELDELSNQFAHYLLKNHQVQLEDFIGVKLERSDWLIVSFLAILKTGSAYLPIDIDYPKERIAFIETDSQCKLIIDDSVISEFKNKGNHQPITRPQVNIQATNLAYVIYTSGSTGTPKGTLLEHRNLLNLCFWHIEKYAVNEHSKGTLYSGIAFDASIWEMSPYLLAGATLYPISDQTIRLDLHNLKTFLNDQKITHSYLPTTICHKLVHENFVSDRITILTGGDTLKIKKAPKFKLYNNYGPTENTVVTTAFNLKDEYKTSIPIGKPIANTSCYIVDENLAIVPIGIPGKLYVSGAGVARGYLHNPELTTERFIANPFAKGKRMYDTGDVAKWLPDGNIEFLGRKDTQIKIRGHRIELEEIENIIFQFSGAIQQVVVSIKQTETEKELVAYYTSKKELEKSELHTFLQEKLPSYMIPKYYVAIDKIPITANGKIDTKSLPKTSVNDLVQNKYVAPNTELEKQLVAIWEEVLGIESIGITDNFFELGGHSLIASKLVKTIAQEIGLEYGIKDVFQHQTIEEFIRHKPTQSTQIVIEKTQGPFPLSQTQLRLWINGQLSVDKNKDIIFIKGKITEAFHLEKFTNAIHKVIARHETLRSIFKYDSTYTAIQQVSEFDNLAINQFIEKIEHEDQIDTSEISKLDALPLFKLYFIQNEYVCFCVHHIIFDGLSFNIFMEELFHYYTNESDLPELPIQYKHYSTWEYNSIEQNKLASQIQFWQEKLKLPIPYFKHAKRDEIKSYAKQALSRSHKNNLTPKLYASIQKFCKEMKLTEHAFFQTVLKITMYQLSNQEDLIIGHYTETRNTADLDKLIGVFLNVLPIRSQIQAEKSYLELLSETQNEIIEAHENKELPFNILLKKLEITAFSPYSFPLIDVFMSYNNITYNNPFEGLIQFEDADISKYTSAAYSMHLNVSKTAFDYKLSWDYNEEIYAPAWIEEWHNKYVQLIKKIITSPSQKI
ncbi:amino acid adenylation domain-containing protein [Kordia sp.]|uniref:amino acid adenylation domain-containing protein n=1 Tax=Kordia sp. TaxID=1965332 RepID=UPI003D270315